MQIRRRSPNPVIAVEMMRYQAPVPDAQPRHILEEIVWHKEVEVDKMRDRLPLAALKQKLATALPIRDFAAALRPGKTTPAVIAEVKKASPSKGLLRADFDAVAIAQAYQRGGATCLSVLTDEKFFQGSFANLTNIRAAVDLPLLCKDFIIYPYQMYWARIQGADAVLLIAAILSDQDLQYFLKIAQTLGMSALIEVHNLLELDRVLALTGVTLIGINNRDLTNFSVDLHTTGNLLTQRRQVLNDRNITIVSESGLHTPADVQLVAAAGAQAVLVGESLITQPDPGQALAHLIAL